MRQCAAVDVGAARTAPPARRRLRPPRRGAPAFWPLLTPLAPLRALAPPGQHLSGIIPKKGSYDGNRRSSAGSGGHRSVAEVERIELEWQALSCCYRTNQGNKWVLKDIYGAAQPGEMQVGPGRAPRAGGLARCHEAPGTHKRPSAAALWSVAKEHVKHMLSA